MSCGVGRRHSLDPSLLWLWRRPVATAPIGPLAWEPPYAPGAAQEIAKRQKKKKKRVLIVAQQVKDPVLRMWVRSLAWLSALRIQHCHEMWCRLQSRLGSQVAMALAEDSGYSSDWTPSLGTSIC